MMEYDTIRIQYRVTIEQEEPLRRCIAPSLWVNDECISEGVTVDLRELVASMEKSGQYDILTCSCGEPGCAGIWEGVVVIHWPEAIRWLIPEPIVKPLEPDDEEEKRIFRFKERCFRKPDYCAAITSALAEAKSLILRDVDSAETVPHGFSVQELLDMRVA